MNTGSRLALIFSPRSLAPLRAPTRPFVRGQHRVTKEPLRANPTQSDLQIDHVQIVMLQRFSPARRSAGVPTRSNSRIERGVRDLRAAALLDIAAGGDTRAPAAVAPSNASAVNELAAVRMED